MRAYPPDNAAPLLSFRRPRKTGIDAAHRGVLRRITGKVKYSVRIVPDSSPEGNHCARRHVVSLEGELMMPIEPTPLPGQPVPVPPMSPDIVPPVKEPEPERLPDEDPAPNPDENDRPPKWN